MPTNPSIAKLVPWMVRNRDFRQYSESLQDARVNLTKILLDKAEIQNEVNFYDLGCGLGRASEDFYPILYDSAKKRNLSETILNKINYFGIDKFNSDFPKNDNKQIHFHKLDITNLHNTSLPPIDVGICLYVLPYLDKKLEAISEVYSHLRQQRPHFTSGEFFFTEYYSDQILVAPNELAGNKSYVDRYSCRDAKLDDLVEGDSGVIKILPKNIIMLRRGEANVKPLPYLTYREELTSWTKHGPVGSRAGQLISFYRESA